MKPEQPTGSSSVDAPELMRSLEWRGLAFDALTAAELYRFLQLRAAVFVVEQACAFQDLDGMDMAAVHLMGEGTDASGATSLLAYTRLLPAGAAFTEASIGRVVTAPSTRGTGMGHALMQASVAEVFRLWGVQGIRIGAQAHLQNFYRRHGFERQGDMYLEDGIEHVEMVRPAHT